MKKLIALTLLISWFGVAAMAKIKVQNLVCEYLVNPIGIDLEKPRLSWKMMADLNDATQSAYEIRVATSALKLSNNKALLWTSGKVESDQSVHVEYGGPALKSGQRVYWQVRIWDNKNKASAWSMPAFWETGLLNTSDWKADWITMNGEAKSESSLPAQYYRKEFKLNKKVKSARLYVSSLGLYQAFINGEKVGDQLFTPGFTSFNKRIQYQTYDVTGMLKAQNVLGAILGDGWYRGYLGWDGLRAYYGDKLALIAQLHMQFVDGTSQTISSNTDWKASDGAIRQSDIYNGETYDARLQPKGWSNANFSDSDWNKVVKLDHSKDVLVASNSVPVKAIEEIKPINIFTTPKGELVMDLGQNMVGFVRLKVQGNKGHKVTLKFAEVLDKDGNFFTKNLRAAKATDVYVLNGEGEEVYEPHFTYHGFRFVQIINYPGIPTLEDITGVVVHSAMKPTGSFSCSDALINQLQKNIQWGQRDNFLDIPTDCPQRDERLGWTGDAQVFSMTAAFNFNVASFYTKWLADLALDQKPSGEVPNVVPDMWGKVGGATGWADAALIVPWTVYRAYGDKRILRDQYNSMKAWVEYMRKHAGDDYLWNEKRHQWGDWLAFHSNSPAYSGAYTEKDLIATAYFKYSTELLSKIASILGRESDAAEYAERSKKIKAAFQQEYLTPNGRLVSHTQTAYALALSFDLLPENVRINAARYFAEDVTKFKHLTTGFLGTPLLCPTLSEIGRDDLAFMLLNRKTYPSWLYPVTQGATTIWERWDTQKPDGTIIDGMNSFNHYAYGAIGEWLYTHLAGIKIDVDKPGYKHILFEPHPGGGLTHAQAVIETMYGKASSSWEKKGDLLTYSITVPANTSASVTLPHTQGKLITLNGKDIRNTKTVQSTLGDNIIVNVGSGKYLFRY